MKTLQEVEELKKEWVKDACWDIEDTEGFEEYKKELKVFREIKEAEWEKAYIEGEKKKYKKLCSNLYSLKLNETLQIDDDIYYRRVPGGWVIEYSEGYFSKSAECFLERVASSVFIQFNKEFKGGRK